MVLGRLTTLPGPCLALLAALSLERGFELWLTHRRLATARRRDGIRGAESTWGWRALVAVHVLLLVLPPLEAIVLGVRAPLALRAAAIAAALLAQVLRYWTVLSLGRAWNARAVVDPGQAVVVRGPYRWIRHPNYLAVLVEFSAIPLAFGATWSWILLNFLHTPLIVRRIRAEERALNALPGYTADMATKGRFLPRLRRSPM